MRINDHIFFAPEILLKDLNLDDKKALIDAFELRFKRYYLSPIKTLNKMRCAFPVAVLEFSMIDALARYSTQNNRVGDRIKAMIRTNFNTSEEVADRAYSDFRNGLLHENHIKNYGQLCYETATSFLIQNDCLIINPLKLQRELDTYFVKYIEALRTDYSVYKTFLGRIKTDFENEIEFFKLME